MQLLGFNLKRVKILHRGSFLYKSKKKHKENSHWPRVSLCDSKNKKITDKNYYQKTIIKMKEYK